ncbi:hypothetical protein JXO59_04080 [candidate division KSB1 bacterium]|nr:hypothetical protein [candidate division KSB1 bacterium]
MAVCSGRADAKQEEALAKICIDTARAYMQILERRGQRIRAWVGADDWNGLAADAVADLFYHSADGKLIYFQRIFAPMCDAPLQADEYLIRLRQIIVRQVHQFLTRLYRQRDPEGGKILRNIRLCVSKHPHTKLTKDINGLHVVYAPNPSASEEGISCPRAELIAGLAHRLWDADMTIAQMVDALLQNLSAAHQRSVSVDLMDLVRLIRNFRTNTADGRNSQDVSTNVSCQEFIHHSQTILADISKIIMTSYVQKGKLSLRQGLCLQAALRDWAEDVVQGESSEDYYSYAHRHWPDLSRQEYFRSLRNVFEYLIKLARDRFKKEAKIFF